MLIANIAVSQIYTKMEFLGICGLFDRMNFFVRLIVFEITTTTQKGRIMFKKLYSALMILCTGSLIAGSHAAPGSFGFTGEYIFFRPSFDDNYFVVKSPDGVTTQTFPDGKKYRNDFDFKSGFRIAADYAFCDCDRDLSIDYVWLRSKHSRTITSTPGTNVLSSTVGTPSFSALYNAFTGTAHAHNTQLYERVDPLYSQSIFNCCGLDVRLVAGLEYAHLGLQEHYTYTTVTPAIGHVNKKSKTWGIGPQVGFDMEYDLWQCNSSCLPGTLTLNVCTTGSIITGTTRFSQLVTSTVGGTTSTELSVSDELTWRMIPAFHTRLGLNYATCFCGWGTDLEIGYEFSTYLRGLAREHFTGTGNDFAQTNYYNYDLQGLYVSASVGF